MSESNHHVFSPAQFRRRHRPLIFFAPSSEDRRYRAQIEILHGHDEEIADREVVVLHVFEQEENGRYRGDTLRRDEAQALRDRSEAHSGAFRVVLVGKDGGTKLTASEPVDPAALFRVIDEMPMRREEMRIRGKP